MRLEVFDPSLCCSSGACGPTVDPELARLIEVPVMLSVCSVCNRTRHWFPAAAEAR